MVSNATKRLALGLNRWIKVLAAATATAFFLCACNTHRGRVNSYPKYTISVEISPFCYHLVFEKILKLLHPGATLPCQMRLTTHLTNIIPPTYIAGCCRLRTESACCIVDSRRLSDMVWDYKWMNGRKSGKVRTG